MEKKMQANLLSLFRANTGKTIVNVPKQTGPVNQYWTSKVERYYR